MPINPDLMKQLLEAQPKAPSGQIGELLGEPSKPSSIPQVGDPVSLPTYLTIRQMRGAKPEELQKEQEYFKQTGEVPTIDPIDLGQALAIGIPNLVTNIPQTLKSIYEGLPEVPPLVGEVISAPLQLPALKAQTRFYLSRIEPPPVKPIEPIQPLIYNPIPRVQAVVETYEQIYGNLDTPEGRQILLNYIAYQPHFFAADVLTIAQPAFKQLMQAGKIAEAASMLKGSTFFWAASIPVRAGKYIVEPTRLPMKLGGAALAYTGEFLAPGVSGIRPNILELTQKYGITEPPATAISKSPAVAVTEARAFKRGQQVILDRIENYGKSLNKIVDDTFNKIDASPDPAITGKLMTEGLDKFETAFRSNKRALYNQVKGLDALPAETSETLGALQKIIDIKNAARSAATDVSYFESLFSDFSAPSTFKNLDRTATEVWNRKKGSDPMAVGNRSFLEWVYAAMERDKDSTILKHQPTLKSAFDQADAYYAQGIQKINGKIGQTIEKYKGQEDKLVNALFGNPKTLSRFDIPVILELVGPDAKAGIEASFTKMLLEKSHTPEGAWRPLALKSVLQNYTDEKLSQILSPETLTALKDVSELAAAARDFVKVAEGAQTMFGVEQMLREANTAQALVQIGETIMMKADPRALLIGLAGTVGSNLFAEFIASPAGQKYLTTGIPAGIVIRDVGNLLKKHPSAIRVPARLGVAAKQWQETREQARPGRLPLQQ